MPIDGAVPLHNWGNLTPVNRDVHITQTNLNSRDGLAAHVTTNIPDLPVKVHDRFDANGNYQGNNFAIK